MLEYFAKHENKLFNFLDNIIFCYLKLDTKRNMEKDSNY